MCFMTAVQPNLRADEIAHRYSFLIMDGAS